MRHLPTCLAAAAAAAAAAAVTTPAAAADAADDARARAVRRAADIDIDGRLDDAGWTSVPAHGDFVQRFPLEGAAPTHRTEFRVAYDDDAIYVGVRAYDSEPDAIRGLLTRRDQPSASDWILIGLDSYHDRRTAFVFGLNPAGVQRDSLIFDDAQFDDSWDAVWAGAARVDADGWTVEVRIPLSQLRFVARDRQQWGLQIVRTVARTGEESTWSPWPRTGNQVVSRFGTLDDIDGLAPGRRLEILPYASGGVATAQVADGDPFHDAAELRYNAGIDVKYGLSSAFTLAATINPDFGQVEADPSVVNLTAQESFFPEKRPFFLEGVDVFRFGLQQGDGNGGEGLFYTRRIGAPPHLAAAAFAEHVDAPDATTIYGAAKISGKTRSGWTLGVLEAVTAGEEAALAGGEVPTLAIEPLTNYAMVRVTKDLREGRTSVAGAVTSVHRRLDAPQLAALLHDQAYTGGVELGHRFGKDLWGTSVKLYGSWVHGTPDAILRDQLDVRHNYQRPDAGHVTLDPARTSLAGAGALWDVGRWNHARWNYGTGGDLRSPGVELNDMGFQRGADQFSQWVWTGYRDTEPSAQVLLWAANLDVWAAGNWEPRISAVGISANVNATLANYWSIAGGVNAANNRWNFTLLRGGPRYHAEDSWNLWLNLNTDGRKRLSAGTNVWTNRRAESDSWSSGGSVWVNLQARSNLELSLGPNLWVGKDDHQYVARVDELVDGDRITRHVLARLDQVTVAATVRAAWTFSPTLSVQLYASPFVASGGFREYKEAADTYADAYADRFLVLGADQVAGVDGGVVVDKDRDGVADYRFGRPDFNVRELNSNLVVRWEYRPGSTVFAIWSHGRGSFEPDGRFRLGHDLAGLAGVTGEHVVMVKANYWIGL
jgi:hypothetical protein